MRAPIPKTITVPAAAGGQPSVYNDASSGNFFYCQTATATFQVQFDGGAVTSCKSGQQLAGSFRRLTFFNALSIAVTITFYFSQDPITYVSDNQQKVASTTSVGRGITSLAAGSTAIYPGNWNGQQRKQLCVHNLDANLQLYIVDGSGNVFDVIYAGQDWTFESDATFGVKNPNGSAVNAAVGEIYYQT